MNWQIIASVVLVVVALFGERLWSLIGSIRLPSIGGKGETVTDDDADLAAFKRLRARLGKCPDAVKGLDVVWSHFWKTGGDIE